jgi:serine/threonine protein kinase
MTHVDVYDWLTPGVVLAGRYRYVAPIAHGRVGLVIRVGDEAGEESALKTIRPKARRVSTAAQLAMTEDALATEFAILRAARHGNVIAARELVRDGRLGLCLVMEYAPGGTLEEAVRRQAISSAETRAVFTRLIDVVRFLHRPSAAFPWGLVHLDLEAKNVVFDARGTPRLCDFHYARPLGPASVGLTSDAEGGIDARTDLLQLGRLLYAVLAGDFEGAVDLDRLPARFRSIVTTLTAAEPDERYQTADELRDAWESLNAGG